MLKQIIIKNIPGVSVGKIIKRHDIVSYQNFNQINDYAQRHARKIIRDAEAIADDIQNRAWTEGYVSGISYVIQDLAKFVNDYESHQNTIIASTLETLTVKLEDFFSHQETSCQLLAILAARLTSDVQEKNRLVITVPEALHPHSYKIRQVFADAGLAAEIKKSPHPGIVVEYGKEIWTYDLHQVADNLARSAMRKALASSQLQEKCEISSLDALRNIRDTLNSYLSDTE